MTEPIVEHCATCNAPIIRAVHERTLKWSVINADAGADGDIQIMPRGDRMPTYRILKVADRFGRTDLHTSHFATCPQAASHRRKRPA